MNILLRVLQIYLLTVIIYHLSLVSKTDLKCLYELFFTNSGFHQINDYILTSRLKINSFVIYLGQISLFLIYIFLYLPVFFISTVYNGISGKYKGSLSDHLNISLEHPISCPMFTMSWYSSLDAYSKNFHMTNNLQSKK